MADRYLRATGNWNGPVWAATSGGVAGSASTPTANDDVYLASNMEVSLTGDAECKSIPFPPGPPPMSPLPSVYIGNHTLHVHGDFAYPIVMSGSGTLVVDGDFYPNQEFNSNFDPTVILNVSGATTFDTRYLTFVDVIVNMGENTPSSTTLDIIGSPTFRSLIIQSKNSAAHTVNIGDNTTVSKFVAIGSSSSNKLTITNPDFHPAINFTADGSSYGQNVDISYVDATGAGVPKYIGSNSVSSNATGWALQDPPKASTLVDPLTTAPGSNPNWTVSGTVTQVTSGLGGGGYEGGMTSGITSTNTYDLVDDTLYFEVNAWYDSAPVYIDGMMVIGGFRPPGLYRIYWQSGELKVEYSDDNGSTWSSRLSMPVAESSFFRSSRLRFVLDGVIGSLNYLPAPPGLEVDKTQPSRARVQKAITSVQDAVSSVRARTVFSRGSYESLPVDDSDLEIPYSPTEASNVSAEDSTYTSQGGGGFVLHEYRVYHNLSTATITVKWVGKTTVPCSEESVYLQIYNYDTGVWLTLDSDSTSGAGTNFELTGTPSGNNGDYYDPDGFIAVRVYQ